MPNGESERNNTAFFPNKIPVTRARFICTLTGSVQVAPLSEIEHFERASARKFPRVVQMVDSSHDLICYALPSPANQGSCISYKGCYFPLRDDMVQGVFQQRL